MSGGTLSAGAGADDLVTLVGGEAGDTLESAGPGSLLRGEAGADWLFSTGQEATLEGGAGADTLIDNFDLTGLGRLPQGGTSLLLGGDSNDHLYAHAGGATLLGESGADLLYALQAQPTGADPANRDVLLQGGDGEDSIGATFWSGAVQGGAGNDLVHVTRTGPIGVSPASPLVSGGDGDDRLSVSHYARTGEVGAPALVHGDAGHDTIYAYTGLTNSAFVFGGAGNDELHGNFILSGDEGADTLTSDRSADGGVGDDLLLGLGLLLGGAGADTLRADDSGAATLSGGHGNDVLTSSSGYREHLLRGNQGADTLAATDASSATTLEGGEGDDLLTTESVRGGDAGGRDHLLTGGAGADTLAARASTGSLDGGAGEDLLSFRSPGAHAGILRGGDGADTLTAEATGAGLAVTLIGGAGDDVVRLVGGFSIVAADAIHLLSGPSSGPDGGQDTLDLSAWRGPIGEAAGGLTWDAGFETVILPSTNPASAPWSGGDGAETRAGGRDATLEGQGGDDHLMASSGRLLGGAGDDRLELYGRDFRAGASSLDGGAGRDYLAGVGTLHGGADADTLHGGAQAATLFGGDGNDSLRGMGALQGDAGDDVLVVDILGLASSLAGGDGADTLAGWARRDTLIGGAGADRLLGRGGSDHLMGGEGEDLLRGGGAKDLLEGSAGRDTLAGGGGDDWLAGGPGNDLLRGGVGNDTFIASADGGTDLLVDFAWDGVWLDRIDISALPVMTFLGDAAFTGTGPESRFDIEYQATRVEFDTDGDGAANAVLRMSEPYWLSEDVFVRLPPGAAGPAAGEDWGDPDRNWLGSDRDELFTGDPYGSAFYGFAGNDTIDGGQSYDPQWVGPDRSPDTLWGGDGDDYLSEDHMNGVVFGGAGADTLQGAGSRLFGGPDNDLYAIPIHTDESAPRMIGDWNSGDRISFFYTYSFNGGGNNSVAYEPIKKLNLVHDLGEEFYGDGLNILPDGLRYFVEGSQTRVEARMPVYYVGELQMAFAVVYVPAILTDADFL